MHRPALMAALLMLLAVEAAADGQSPAPTANDGWVRFDRSFFDVAVGTGGSFAFWEPGEFAAAPAAAIGLHGTEKSCLLYAHGEGGGTTRTFSIPVDASCRRLGVFAGHAGPGSVELRDPSGALVARAEGVEVFRTRHMFLAQVDAPQAGAWKLVIHAQGLFLATARARSPIGFDLRLQEGGRVPVDVANPTNVTARVEGAAESVRFVLLGIDGERIEDLDLARNEAGDYSGLLPVPGRPFRIAMEGKDGEGHPLRRVDAVLHRGPTPR